MAGHKKPRPRSGGVNFNNLVSIQPAGAIQAMRSDLFRFALLNTRSIRKKATFFKDYISRRQIVFTKLHTVLQCFLKVFGQRP